MISMAFLRGKWAWSGFGWTAMWHTRLRSISESRAGIRPIWAIMNVIFGGKNLFEISCCSSGQKSNGEGLMGKEPQRRQKLSICNAIFFFLWVCIIDGSRVQLCFAMPDFGRINRFGWDSTINKRENKIFIIIYNHTPRILFRRNDWSWKRRRCFVLCIKSPSPFFITTNWIIDSGLWK